MHLIGSHPNYSARYTPAFQLFPSQEIAAEQQVAQQLKQAGVGAWTRHLRDEYDNSVVYQDFIFDQVLALLKQDKAADRGLLFLSDHGNEVGHIKDFAGHSPSTEAGYRIPVIIWHNQLSFTKGVNRDTVIDATQTDKQLLWLMGLTHQTDTPFIPWTDMKYQFQPAANYPYYWQKR